MFLTRRIIFVLVAFVSLGFMIYLIEVMRATNIFFIPVLAGFAFVCVGIYAIYLLMRDIRERRRRTALD